MNNFIGVDLHKKTITVCVLNKGREALDQMTFCCAETERISEWFASWRPFEVVVEATAAYEWFVRLVEPLAERVLLAHPGKMRIIAQSTRKSDKYDAKMLAWFLACDMVPEAFRPLPRQREHRRLLRWRKQLKGGVTSVKCRIRNLLADYNADRPTIFTQKSQEYVRGLKLAQVDRFVLEELLAELSFFNGQLHKADQEIKKFAESAPPAEAQARRLLDTIPGVGPVTIETFLSEIGDVKRFSSQKKITAYVGLAPGQRESAGHRHELGITHAGSGPLRWALNQASWQLVRRSARWQRIFEDIAKRRGKKKAITAISRRLLCMMTAIVSGGQPYRLEEGEKIKLKRRSRAQTAAAEPGGKPGETKARKRRAAAPKAETPAAPAARIDQTPAA